MDVTGIDIDNEHLAIADAQKSVYNLDVTLNEISSGDSQPAATVDFVIAISVLWHILGLGKLPAAPSDRELMTEVDTLVGKPLFWGSGQYPQRELDLIASSTGRRDFKKLGTTSATGISNRVLGVFSR